MKGPMTETQKYYRMSREKAEIGTSLQGKGTLHVGPEIENMLENKRPDGCIPRADCVFFSDTEDATKHGLTYDYGYLQLVEPIGPVQKRDNYWIGQLQLRHQKKHDFEDVTIAHLTDEELADKYWNGEPSKKPNWEMVARSATVTGYAHEEPVKVRKSRLEDALRAVAEYDASKAAEE
jgi:hypothetical protein